MCFAPPLEEIIDVDDDVMFAGCPPPPLPRQDVRGKKQRRCSLIEMMSPSCSHLGAFSSTVTLWPFLVHSIAAVRPPKPAPTITTLIPVLGYPETAVAHMVAVEAIVFAVEVVGIDN